MSYPGGDEIDTNEFDCPNCGERVHIEMLACPKCGLHFYDEGGNRPESFEYETKKSVIEDYGLSISAILAGVLASAGIAFLANLIASQFWTAESLNITGQVILSIIGPIGAGIGGYLTASLSDATTVWRKQVEGFLVSMVSLFAAFLLYTHWQVPGSIRTSPLFVIGWGILMIAGPLGAMAKPGKSAEKHTWESSEREKRLYLDLLAYVRHDINVAERLIENERRRSPRSSRIKLIERAIARVERGQR